MGVALRVISRSDSTLRGHFPAETEALAAGLGSGGLPVDCILVCPAYPEAGRVTANDVHWLRTGDQLTPVGDSEFARDLTFGYSSSDLKDWIRERAGRTVAVASISLREVRRGGPSHIADRLLTDRESSRYVIANAVESSDLDAIALGAELAEKRGTRVLARTGPSFLSARAGMPTAPPLRPNEVSTRGGRGLVVIGSHTALSTAQLTLALKSHELAVVPLDVTQLIGHHGRSRNHAISGAAAELRRVLAAGDGVLVTSRDRAEAEGRRALEAGDAIGRAVVDVVRAVAIDVNLDWLIAKGGITSHNIAMDALGVRRASVLGQLFPGKVSVWRLGADSVRPGLRYVVFAGNIGDERSLRDALDLVKGSQ